MEKAAGYFRPRCKSADLGWRRAKDYIILAKLAVVVPAPKPESTISFSGNGKEATTRYIEPRSQNTNLYWGGTVNYIVFA